MRILKDTVREFLHDDCPRMAAALSYYTMFSLPAFLMLVMLIAGFFADPADLQGRILVQIELLIGAGAAEQVGEILRHPRRPGAGNPLIAALSVAALLFAATGAFAQLQATLNRVWGVAPDPSRGDVRNFLTKRVLSFAMILGVALLLLLASLGNTLLTAFGGAVDALLPPALSAAGLRLISFTFSLVAATLLFSVLFHVLPDARVEWKDAWIGAAATGTLFVLGNILLGLYLARSDPGSAFGAAGSLALIMIWVYYSSIIFFLGAELTQVLARHRGAGIRPSPGAVRVVTERRTLRDESR